MCQIGSLAAVWQVIIRTADAKCHSLRLLMMRALGIMLAQKISAEIIAR
jgi:hypothetical protein